MTTWGMIGLGEMGLPMARNLVAGGIEVGGWDVGEPARELAAEAGIGVAAPADLNGSCDVIGICVRDEAQAAEAVDALGPGERLLVLHSTIGRGGSRRIGGPGRGPRPPAARRARQRHGHARAGRHADLPGGRRRGRPRARASGPRGHGRAHLPPRRDRRRPGDEARQQPRQPVHGDGGDGGRRARRPRRGARGEAAGGAGRVVRRLLDRAQLGLAAPRVAPRAPARRRRRRRHGRQGPAAGPARSATRSACRCPPRRWRPSSCR